MPAVPSPVTLQTLATLSGFAVTTVAAALRGEQRISLATREKISALALQHGYRRNLAASLLGARRVANQPTLGAALLVRLNDGSSPYATPFQTHFRNAGWSFQVVNLSSSEAALPTAKRLLRSGVDALLLGPTTPPDLLLKDFPWSDFAVISLIRHRVGEGFDTVRTNHFNSMLRLIGKVRELGYRRIGILHRRHSPAIEDDEARLAASLLLRLRDTGQGARLSILEVPLNAPALDHPWPETVDAWIVRQRLEVIIGFNPADSHLLKATGRSVPNDIAFAALHTFRRHQPNWAGLEAPAEVLAPIAALRLEQKMRLGERGLSTNPIETVVTPNFIPGSSLPDLTRKG